ncbi:hypothetical protein [Bradyrhizobium sp. ARR65]|uniref:hypothetical protein n=1 Tax=Bradyrhizobium sp. ARR65 TaxID=1040989 RepID=UPI000463D3A0|nr:hypothetical protein [Bradyrhizobium sp. ARR65]
MNASSRTRLVLPLISLMAVWAVPAQAQESKFGNPGQPPANQAAPGRPAMQAHPARPGGGGPGRAADARFAHGAVVARDFGGHAYRGRVDWHGGRWRHEMHDGRMGWWWDVGGVWYYYPERMDGPPTYISEDYADDVVYADAPPPDAYAPPTAAYAPPPPPPPPPAPDPGASALGGAIVGGVLGGLLTGHASGAAAGAVIGGATGAIAGATAASRPGYYLAQGNCYYRYPNGQYVQADPRWCY